MRLLLFQDLIGIGPGFVGDYLGMCWNHFWNCVEIVFEITESPDLTTLEVYKIV